jgi:nucleoid-associated protein YgaU
MDLKESTGPVFHVVQHDETLAKIALSYFGFWNPAVLREIRELNPDLVDPNQIKVGQSIRFPREIRSDVAATGARPPASVPPQTQKMNP